MSEICRCRKDIRGQTERAHCVRLTADLKRLKQENGLRVLGLLGGMYNYIVDIFLKQIVLQVQA